jgi:hypothetical protein
MLYPQTPMQGMRIGENYSEPSPKRETLPGERGFLRRRPRVRGTGDGRLLASSICGHCGCISQRYGASA